jgi:hypothetical protein
MSIAEELKITLCYQGLANAVDCDVVNMENFHRGAFVITHTGANDTDLVLALYESDDVSKSNTAAITTACPFYLDIDAGTSSDTLVRQTDAYAKTIDPATENGVVAVFEIDPAILSDGYPCVYVSDSGGHASNYCTIHFIGEPRHRSASLPSAIA